MCPPNRTKGTEALRHKGTEGDNALANQPIGVCLVRRLEAQKLQGEGKGDWLGRKHTGVPLKSFVPLCLCAWNILLIFMNWRNCLKNKRTLSKR